MKYKNFNGRLIDTDKEDVECPWCNKAISREDIDHDNVYQDGASNTETREEWCELMHSDCAEKASDWRRDKYGY